MNLLRETLSILDDDGYSPADITFIGSSDHAYAISWNDFQSISDVDYDAGYGSPEVATDLIIELKDGSWYTREEYDGSEWWRLNKRSPEFINPSRIHTVVWPYRTGWNTIAEMNRDSDIVNLVVTEELETGV